MMIQPKEFFSFSLCPHRVKFWSFCLCLLFIADLELFAVSRLTSCLYIIFWPSKNKHTNNIPTFNELILQGTFLILSRSCITAVCSDWQLLVIWYDRHLKEEKLAKHHCYWEVILHVGTHEPFVRKHIQRESEVSFSFIVEHELSVPWLPSNRWHHTIFWIKTAKFYFYFTNTCHHIFYCDRNFQHCVGIDDSRGGVPACCITASQRCCDWEVGACLCSFATGVQESKMVTVHTKEKGLGDDNGHVFTVTQHVNTWC